MKYEIKRIVPDSIVIDFDKVYDYVLNEYLTNQDDLMWDMSCEFGDNMTYVLKDCCGISLSNAVDVEQLEDAIYTDWCKFLEKKINKKVTIQC